MRYETIDLPVSVRDGWRILRAEIVDVAPHIEATFAVHETQFLGWSVTHVETGTAVIQCANSPAEALHSARTLLARQTNASMQAAISKLPKWCRE